METAYRASQASPIHRKRQRRAVIVALCMGSLAALGAAWAATLWDKPPSWVPLLGGLAITIIVYGLIAPES